MWVVSFPQYAQGPDSGPVSPAAFFSLLMFPSFFPLSRVDKTLSRREPLQKAAPIKKPTHLLVF